ncbi:MAG TPA: V-type ATP synthase subunit K [Phycisphaerae bacterium]|nr:V-type ATP synthase subunit K [Phycisphaerae bacterium]
MDATLFLGQLGMALTVGMAAVGSALGVGAAGMSAAGAWAKDAKAGKGLRFIYVVLVSMPITQTLYGFIVMSRMAPKLAAADKLGGVLFAIGLATGVGEMASAWIQGLIGAAGCRMLSDSDGKGFAFVVIAMGIAETVGVFTFLFMLYLIGQIGG